MKNQAFTMTRKTIFGGKKRVVVSRQVKQTPIGQHKHEFFEIAIILSGQGTHVTGNYRHVVEAGDVLVLNPRRTHGYENPKNLNLINILVRNDLLAKIGRALGHRPGYHQLFCMEPSRWRKDEYHACIHLSAHDLERVEEWTDRMEAESSRGAGALKIVEEACLALVVDLLCERCKNPPPVDGKNKSSNISSKLGKVLAWIEKNLHRTLSIADLAEKMSVSERTLHRIFQEELQNSPQKYLAMARMHKAAYLLSEAPYTEQSITEIALACGFEDSNYFTRCFHRFSGMPPREYLKKAT